jgi:polysaccharide export outer membrane protein
MKNRYLRMKILAPVALCGLAWSQAEPSPTPSPTATKASSGASEQAASNRIGDASYVIGPGDIIGVNVWKEPDVSKAVPVRSDGKISLPLAGELQASGITPKELEQAISGRLQSYISDPEVTVIVQEIRSQRFNILGQISKPGTYILTDSTSILDAIAMAGGFRDFARQKSIYVLRTRADGTQERLPFNYKQVIKGGSEAQNIKLEPHDTIVVP